MNYIARQYLFQCDKKTISTSWLIQYMLQKYIHKAIKAIPSTVIQKLSTLVDPILI